MTTQELIKEFENRQIVHDADGYQVYKFLNYWYVVSNDKKYERQLTSEKRAINHLASLLAKGEQ